MSKNLFKLIDTQIFTLVDHIKNSSGYQQLFSPLDGLTDEMQMYVNRAISIVITVIPFAIFIVLVITNIQTRLSLMEKTAFLEDIQKVISLNNLAKSYGANLISPKKINSQEEFKNQLNLMTSNAQIQASQVSIKDFDQEKMGSLNKSMITIAFNSFSTIQLTSFLDKIMISEKIKITAIDIAKKDSLLDGSLKLIHFGKTIETIDKAEGR